jgi:hypothetical protein
VAHPWQRRSVVAIMLARLLPLGWYHVSVSDHLPHPRSPPEPRRSGDGQVLDDLRADGFAIPDGAASDQRRPNRTASGRAAPAPP